jgi:hypothetical protein
MEIWEHGGRLYEYTSAYCVTDACWMHELTETVARPGDQPAMLVVTIPDASPESSSFTPAPAADVTFAVVGRCEVPWRIMSRFLETIYATGDLSRTG